MFIRNGVKHKCTVHGDTVTYEQGKSLSNEFSSLFLDVIVYGIYIGYVQEILQFYRESLLVLCYYYLKRSNHNV